MDGCQRRRRKHAQSLVVVSLWLPLLVWTVSRFFILDQDGFRLVPKAPGDIRPGWEAVMLVIVLLTALSEYATVAVIVHLAAVLLERTRQNLAQDRP